MKKTIRKVKDPVAAGRHGLNKSLVSRRQRSIKLRTVGSRRLTKVSSAEKLIDNYDYYWWMDFFE